MQGQSTRQARARVCDSRFQPSIAAAGLRLVDLEAQCNADFSLSWRSWLPSLAAQRRRRWLLGSQVADLDGIAVHAVDIPMSLGAPELTFQAVIDRGPTSLKTPTQTVRLVDGGPDLDADGFCSGAACADPGDSPGDCDDLDPLIHPAAEDLPDAWHLDSNCDGLGEASGQGARGGSGGPGGEGGQGGSGSGGASVGAVCSDSALDLDPGATPIVTGSGGDGGGAAPDGLSAPASGC
jgi:uncharacterized membrane protein YgcG